MLGSGGLTFLLWVAGYSFFDSGDVELLGHRRRTPYQHVGECVCLGCVCAMG